MFLREYENDPLIRETITTVSLFWPSWLQLIVIKWTWMHAGEWKVPCIDRDREHTAVCWIDRIWPADTKMNRWVPSARPRCEGHCGAGVDRRTFVGKQIHLRKGHHSFLFLHPLFISSCSFLLSVYFSSLSYFHEDLLSLAGRSSVCQTAALSAFSGHQSDCTATGGYITAVSGQQQVPGAACQPICAPTSPTGCRWPSACTSPTHTHTHATGLYARQHSSRLVSFTTRAGEKTVTLSPRSLHNIHKHLANTYVQCKKNPMHIEYSNAGWLSEDVWCSRNKKKSLIFASRNNCPFFFPPSVNMFSVSLSTETTSVT